MPSVGHIVAFARGNQQAHSVVHPGDLEPGDLLRIVLEDVAIHSFAVALQDGERRHVVRIAREQARRLRRVIVRARMRGWRVKGRFLRWHNEERTSQYNPDLTYTSLNVELQVVFSCGTKDLDVAAAVLPRLATANDLEFQATPAE